MKGWLGFLLFGSQVCAVIVCSIAAYRRGYVRGSRKGYENGRIDAEGWWLKQGAAIDQTREAMKKEAGWP